MRGFIVVVALLGGASLEGAARAQQPSPQLGQQVADLAQRIAPGQRAVSPVFGTYGANRRGVSYLVPLTASHCYTLVGAGGIGVVDVDMFLFDPADSRVALDRRYDPYTQIFYCAPFTGNYRVELKVKSGAGEVAFQVYEAEGAGAQQAGMAPPPAATPQNGAASQQPPVAAQPPGAAPPNVATQQPAPGATTVNAVPLFAPGYAPAPAPAGYAPAPATTANDALAQQVYAVATSAAPGAHPVGSLLGGFTADGRGQDLFVPLEAGHCYRLITVGAPTIHKIRTYLWAPLSGRRVADNDGEPISILVHCATQSGAFHFQAKARDGYGEFRTGVYAN